jgi:hypothetical protein
VAVLFFFFALLAQQFEIAPIEKKFIARPPRVARCFQHAAWNSYVTRVKKKKKKKIK